MKIYIVRAELFHVERQTDMTKVIVASRNFANAPKKWNSNECHVTRRDFRYFD